MNRLAPSNKEENSKTAFHVLLFFELLPKELVHEHRLVRGCFSSVLIRVLKLFSTGKELFPILTSKSQCTKTTAHIPQFLVQSDQMNAKNLLVDTMDSAKPIVPYFLF